MIITKDQTRSVLLLVLLLTFVGFLVYEGINSIITNWNAAVESTVVVTSTTVADVPKTKVFDAMADIENYPKILPGNVISVEIINRTNNTIFAEEELQEAGMRVHLAVKHTMVPYSMQKVEVENGATKGTIITEAFEGKYGNSTQLTTKLEIHVHGIMSLLNGIADENLIHAINTVTDKFVTYVKSQS